MKIAISGKAGAGKTTAANYLIRKYGFNTIKFAAPLYRVMEYAQKEFGFEIKKDRAFLQYIGGWARNHARNNSLPDPVISIITSKIKELEIEDKHIVIDDLRMKQELVALEEQGFVYLRLTGRSENINMNHVTEIDLDDVQMFEI
jgi:dephospho-CoA kinase